MIKFITPLISLLQATSSKNAVACYTSDDEDERSRLEGGGGASGGVGGATTRAHGSGLGRLRSNKNN